MSILACTHSVVNTPSSSVESNASSFTADFIYTSKLAVDGRLAANITFNPAEDSSMITGTVICCAASIVSMTFSRANTDTR